MTAKDRAFLAERSRGWPQFGANEVILSLFACMLGSGAIFAFVTFASWLSGLIENAKDWDKVPVVFWTVATACAGWCLYAVWSLGKGVFWNRVSKTRNDQISRDLANGQVWEELFSVEAVKRFREPEHLSEFYAILIADGRILVLLDESIQDFDGVGSRKSTFRPAKTLRITTFPLSGLKRFEFEGERIRKPKATMLTTHPRHWPEDETWCEIAWDQLEATLAP
jgi:hypothetical protein